jgi:hypothetical protein
MSERLDCCGWKETLSSIRSSPLKGYVSESNESVAKSNAQWLIRYHSLTYSSEEERTHDESATVQHEYKYQGVSVVYEHFLNI